MKKYDRNMDVFEFIKLAREKGLHFSGRRCGFPGFREQVLQKLENGESVHDIQSWHDYRYYGIIHTQKKEGSSESAEK